MFSYLFTALIFKPIKLLAMEQQFSYLNHLPSLANLSRTSSCMFLRELLEENVHT